MTKFGLISVLLVFVFLIGGCLTSDDKKTPVPGATWIVTENTLTDPDGNNYTTVTIGNQVWTLENLRTTKYNDGTAIPHVTDSTEWRALTTPAYCFYNNSTDSVANAKWGALYNWYVVETANPKQIAPEGWRVPTDADWTVLEDYLIANGYNWDVTKSGNKVAKSIAAKTDWRPSPIAGAIGNDLSKNNARGFSALPGGYRYDIDGFNYIGYDGYWWSATEDIAASAWDRSLYYGSAHFFRYTHGKGAGLSVRLLRD